jgi:hypothetical protein
MEGQITIIFFMLAQPQREGGGPPKSKNTRDNFLISCIVKAAQLHEN